MRTELQAARTALGWTQQQLGEAADLPATLVCSIERGAGERLATAMREPLRERVTASLDGDPDIDATLALSGLRLIGLTASLDAELANALREHVTV